MLTCLTAQILCNEARHDLHYFQKRKKVNLFSLSKFVYAHAYIIAAADGHDGMTGSDLFSVTGSRQVIIRPAVGITAGDGWELIQRQILVLQTAEHAKRQITLVSANITVIHMT